MALVDIVNRILLLLLLAHWTGQHKVFGAELPPICLPGAVYDPDDRACCTVCDKGFGVALPCTHDNTTECAPCKDKESYSPRASHKETCHACSHCPVNSFVLHQCNVTHNTQCQCSKGYFVNGNGQCDPCAECEAGYGVEAICTSYRNTKCKRCREGYFSDVKNAHSSCMECSKCTNGYSVHTPCTLKHDTVCEDAGDFSRAGGDLKQGSMVPIYCAILGAVVVVLVIYVIAKRMRTSTCHTGKLSTTKLNVEAMLTTHSPRRCPSASASPSEHTKPMIPKTLLDHRFNELSPHLCKEIESALLNDTTDHWISWFSFQLGYCDDVVRSLVAQHRAGSRNELVFCLREWMDKGKNATPRELNAELSRVGRHDLVNFILKELQNQKDCLLFL